MSFGVRYRNRKKGRIFYKYTDFEDYPDSFLQILFREKQGSGPKRRGKTQSRFETCKPARKTQENPFSPLRHGNTGPPARKFAEERRAPNHFPERVSQTISQAVSQRILLARSFTCSSRQRPFLSPVIFP